MCYSYAATASFSLFAAWYPITHTAPTRASPMRSVRLPGTRRVSPPTMQRILSHHFMLRNTKPLKPAATPKIPIMLVMVIITTSGAVGLMKSIAGFMAMMYGTMNAAMARRLALNAVFIGPAFAMAAPA